MTIRGADYYLVSFRSTLVSPAFDRTAYPDCKAWLRSLRVKPLVRPNSRVAVEPTDDTLWEGLKQFGLGDYPSAQTLSRESIGVATKFPTFHSMF